MARIVGETIGDLRRRRGFSQAALAERAASSPSRVADIEAGVADAELGEIVALARALGVAASQLMAEVRPDELT